MSEGHGPVLALAITSVLVLGGLLIAAWVSGDKCDRWSEDGPPEGCWPCDDAMDHHATEWANGEGNGSWHLQRRAHWDRARSMGADCSDWREADEAARNQTDPAKSAGPEDGAQAPPGRLVEKVQPEDA